MNKVIKYLLSVAVGLATLSSCETYGDHRPYEVSAIGPVMSGYWLGQSLEDITDPANVKVLLDATDFYWAFDPDEKEYSASPVWVQTYAAADESKTQMWVWYNGALGFRGKVGIDLSNYSILPTKGTSNLKIASKTHDFEVLSGNIKVNGYDTRSGRKSDLLTLIYTSEAPATKGKTLKLTAWRDTQWPADYPAMPTE